MTDYKRWYDQDPSVSQCFNMFEKVSPKVKHKLATFLMEEIINKPPYFDMISDEIFELATGEPERRRWYDDDEIVRIYVELLRHVDADIQKELAIKSLEFLEGAVLEGFEF